MDDIDRFKAYSAMADTSRKWVSVLDAKAGFISALCSLVIGFVWTSAKLQDPAGVVKFLSFSATGTALLALYFSLMAVLPRISLTQAFGQKLAYSANHKPISFFGYVAAMYPAKRHRDFVDDVDAMDEKALAREALEQHYTICHVLNRKNSFVALAGWIWFASATQVVASLVWKG